MELQISMDNEAELQTQLNRMILLLVGDRGGVGWREERREVGGLLMWSSINLLEIPSRFDPNDFVVFQNNQFAILLPFKLNQLFIDFIHSFQNFFLVGGPFKSFHNSSFLVDEISFH